MADTSGTLWDSIVSSYDAFDAWSGDVFRSVGNVILHPVNTVTDAAGTVVKPVADFATGTLWKVIIILALAVTLYIIFKDEIREVLNG